MEQNQIINGQDCKLKWQKEYACEVKLMDNQTLLQEILDDSAGDVGDGDFTSGGLWMFKFLIEEINVRLMNAGWMNERVEL
jgi:hypothetical protein